MFDGEIKNGNAFRYHNGSGYESFIVAADIENNFNWSLGPLYCQADVEKNRTLVEGIVSIFKRRKVKKIYAPSVAAHSARIVGAKELTTRIELGQGIVLYRNKDLPSDGVPIQVGEGWIMSGGGCPVLIATGRGICIPMHASRESLIDLKRIETGESSRQHESVIHATAAYFKERGINLGEVVLRGCWNVKPENFLHPFDDPKHGSLNVRRYEDLLDRYGPSIMTEPNGCLSLPELVMHIAKSLGFAQVGFSRSLNSNEADTRHKDKKFALMRNLVGVHRFP